MGDALLWHLRPSATGRQLVMFPFLGGFGASFNGLVARLSADWDVWVVNPPGHGSSTHSAVDNLDDLVDWYARELREVLRPDAVLFGHSMGAVMAYWTLVALERSGRGPCAGPLVLSGSRGPVDLPVSSWWEASDTDLLLHLVTIEALPPELARDRSFVQLVLPAFRADYRVLEEARRRAPVPLDVRTWLVLGECDPWVPTGAQASWRPYVSGPVRTHVLAGEGHMFVRTAFAALDRILTDVHAAHEHEIGLVRHG